MCTLTYSCAFSIGCHTIFVVYGRALAIFGCGAWLCACSCAASSCIARVPNLTLALLTIGARTSGTSALGASCPEALELVYGFGDKRVGESHLRRHPCVNFPLDAFLKSVQKG